MVSREHRPRRGLPVRPERHRVLVYCGGLRTEPAYFDGVRRMAADRPVALEVRAKGVSPAQLISHAAAFARQNPGFYDEVWCVVDVDDFDIDTAKKEADRCGVLLAFSNPCFELWLLLHLADQRRTFVNCDSVARELRRSMPHYDKTRLRFADFAQGVMGAVNRAKALDPTGEAHRANPSTGVWRLVERIIQ